MRSINVIRLYAPKSDSGEEDHEEFYNHLLDTIKASRSFYKIIIGDFNARVWKRRDNEKFTGPHSEYLITFETNLETGWQRSAKLTVSSSATISSQNHQNEDGHMFHLMLLTKLKLTIIYVTDELPLTYLS